MRTEAPLIEVFGGLLAHLPRAAEAVKGLIEFDGCGCFRVSGVVKEAKEPESL